MMSSLKEIALPGYIKNAIKDKILTEREAMELYGGDRNELRNLIDDKCHYLLSESSIINQLENRMDSKNLSHWLKGEFLTAKREILKGMKKLNKYGLYENCHKQTLYKSFLDGENEIILRPTKDGKRVEKLTYSTDQGRPKLIGEPQEANEIETIVYHLSFFKDKVKNLATFLRTSF